MIALVIVAALFFALELLKPARTDRGELMFPDSE